MHSPPPERKEDVAPRLGPAQSWVHGYYEPMAGAWIWHPGRVVKDRPGYRIVDAKYVELGGEFHVSHPYWAPARVANRQ